MWVDYDHRVRHEKSTSALRTEKLVGQLAHSYDSILVDFWFCLWHRDQKVVESRGQLRCSVVYLVVWHGISLCILLAVCLTVFTFGTIDYYRRPGRTAARLWNRTWRSVYSASLRSLFQWEGATKFNINSRYFQASLLHYLATTLLATRIITVGTRLMR